MFLLTNWQQGGGQTTFLRNELVVGWDQMMFLCVTIVLLRAESGSVISHIIACYVEKKALLVSVCYACRTLAAPQAKKNHVLCLLVAPQAEKNLWKLLKKGGGQRFPKNA